MSVTLAAPTSIAAPQHLHRPTFTGTLQGELLKISRQRPVWVMSVVMLGAMFLPYLLFLLRPNLHAEVTSDPLLAIYPVTQIGFTVVRVFSGFYLLTLAALVIGLEYQHGTIRILLARGVGKLQLLGAKMAAIALVGLGIVVADLLVQALMTPALVLYASGSLSGLSAITAQFWSDSSLYLLSLLISMGASALLGIGVTVVGRSLAFGLGVGLSWFAADNIGVLVMMIITSFTHNDFWANVTAYFLGPLLNALPMLMIPPRTTTVPGAPAGATLIQSGISIGSQPLVAVTETQALLTILAYAVIFAATAIVLTWRRDVLE